MKNVLRKVTVETDTVENQQELVDQVTIITRNGSSYTITSHVDGGIQIMANKPAQINLVASNVFILK